MKKIVKLAVLLYLAVCIFQAGTVWADKNYLRENLIRVHIVADSDAEASQELKLQVKDAIVAYLTPHMEVFSDQQDALTFLQRNLDGIKEIANDVLAAAGSNDQVQVSIGEDAFDTRQYDSFSLPAGIYNSLRVQIGSGEGKNWWCVAFPSLCIPTSSQKFTEVAVSAGMGEELADTLANDGEYELRFYLLDYLGKIENLFFKN